MAYFGLQWFARASFERRRVDTTDAQAAADAHGQKLIVVHASGRAHGWASRGREATIFCCTAYGRSWHLATYRVAKFLPQKYSA
jgi:hypothetical protein